MLAQVSARSGFDDRQFRSLDGGKVLGSFRDDVQCALGPSQAPLAVGLRGAVKVDSREPAHRPELAQRFCIVADCVGGERCRLAHDVDAARTPHCGLRVFVCELGVGIEQFPARMRCLPTRSAFSFRQGAKPAANVTVEVVVVDIGRDVRRPLALILGGRLGRVSSVRSPVRALAGTLLGDGSERCPDRSAPALGCRRPVLGWTVVLLDGEVSYPGSRPLRPLLKCHFPYITKGWGVRVGLPTLFVWLVSGGVLLSHTLPCAVPSALKGLASGFGMGPGVSP